MHYVQYASLITCPVPPSLISAIQSKLLIEESAAVEYDDSEGDDSSSSGLVEPNKVRDLINGERRNDGDIGTNEGTTGFRKGNVCTDGNAGNMEEVCAGDLVDDCNWDSTWRAGAPRLPPCPRGDNDEMDRGTTDPALFMSLLIQGVRASQVNTFFLFNHSTKHFISSPKLWGEAIRQSEEEDEIADAIGLVKIGFKPKRCTREGDDGSGGEAVDADADVDGIDKDRDLNKALEGARTRTSSTSFKGVNEKIRGSFTLPLPTSLFKSLQTAKR
jgi:hypothetical protein